MKTKLAKPRKAAPVRGADLPLPKADLLRIYRSMVTTRVLDERAMMLQRQGRIGFYLTCTGQEAAQVGSIHALEPRDWVFPAYRETAVLVHRDVPLDLFIAQLYGNGMDLVKGRQMPNHVAFRSINYVSVSSPIGTQITQAVGAAMASRYRKDGAVMITYFGDGATSSNDFHAGMNFAGVAKSPVIFFCQNNQWAISLPRDQQSASESIAVKAEAYGFPGIQVDGNDFFAVHEATRAAAERARRGDGPTLIEAVTYRLGGHSSSDDPTKYRNAAEVEGWKKKDPIVRFRTFLEEKGIWSEADEKRLWDEARARIADVVKAVEAAPPPEVGTLFTDVFAGMTPTLAEQRSELESEIRERGGTGHGDGAFPL